MRKQAPFRHPTDLRRDDRIADLIAVHGHAGYGVYWMILEILHSHENMQVPYEVKTIRRMAAQVGMPHKEFHNLLQDMLVDYDLFEIADWQPDTGQQGYIRSTIAFRKPRKAKQTVETNDIKEIEDTSSSAPAPGQEAVPPVVKQEEDDTCPSPADSTAGGYQHNSTDTSPIQQHRRSLRAARRQRNSTVAARQQQHYSSKNTV